MRPSRRHPRLKQYDYSAGGVYFLTICTKGRAPILSTSAESDLQLSEIGQILNTQILALERRFPGIEVMKYVIMPDHVHLLLAIPEPAAGASPRPTVSAIVGALKSIVTRDINARFGTPGRKWFQASFHDRVIRDENDFQTHWMYIDNNPRK